MHNDFYLKRQPLSTRLVVSFMGLIVLSVLAIGLPAMHLIRQELARQVQARLDLGSSTTRVLYEAQLREMQALATLSAERPTLQTLLREQDRIGFEPYLETLRATAEIDLLLVLDGQDNPIAYAPLSLPEATFAALPHPPPTQPGAQFFTIQVGGAPMLAIVGHAPARDEQGAVLGTVLALTFLDEAFLTRLNQETGLLHNLFLEERRIVATLPALPEQAETLPVGLHEMGGELVYLHPLPLEAQSGGVTALLALPARGIAEAQTQLLRILGLSTLSVMMVAALLAYLLARHISAPLQQLVRASEGVGRGDLTTAIAVSDTIAEVAILARTLEQMRRRLQHAYEALHQAKQWHETLLASLTEGVVTVDQAGHLTSFSPGAERMLGWQARDVIGRPYEMVFQRGTERSQARAPLRTTPGTVIRESVLTRLGEPVILSITSGAVTARVDGQWEQAYVFRNITEEERALRLREFLLANLSHEFKTPLTALHAATQLLASELPVLAPAELEQLVHSVWQGTRRLEELIDNLLSSASLHTGHFVVRPRPTDLEMVIEEVLLDMQPLLALKEQWLKVDAPSPLRPVEADARRVQQALLNLISNASKFGPSGAPILLRVEEQAEDVRIEISDSGPGIPPARHSLLFQPFSRQEENGPSGIGLGLSIVRAIVERHGGNVGLRSAPGEGATFWFTLPTRPPDSKESEADRENSGRR